MHGVGVDVAVGGAVADEDGGGLAGLEAEFAETDEAFVGGCDALVHGDGLFAFGALNGDGGIGGAVFVGGVVGLEVDGL